MAISDAAFAAIQFWTRDTAVTMVAIAGPESGYRNDAAGDHISGFSPADQILYAPYDCNGYLSWGLWQIFMGAHHAKVQAATASDDPCVWANWLKIPLNNASMAHRIWQAQGFQAWTAYRAGAYLAYKAGAELAVDLALGLPPPSPIPLPNPVPPPSLAVPPPSIAVPPPPSL